MKAPKALVLRSAGTNCEVETKHALTRAGADVDIVHVGRFLESPQSLHPYRIVVFPGGFSYGDDIASGVVFGVEMRKRVTPELRRRGKTLNFAVIYGMSDFGLARSLAIPVKQAHDLIEAYFARFPGVRRYTEETIRQAREQGYVTTLPPYRRRRYIPGIHAGNRNEKLNAERAAVK